MHTPLGYVQCVYGRVHEVRALVCHGVPILAATATATKAVREAVIDELDM